MLTSNSISSRPPALTSARRTSGAFAPSRGQRLIGLLGTLGSEHDGEIFNARQQAHRTAQDTGLSRAAVVDMPQEQPPRRDALRAWRDTVRVRRQAVDLMLCSC